MKNSITFLGTGTSTGIPMIGCHCSVCSSTDPKDKRLRSSAYVEYEGFKILIDCGPDFRTQALANGIERVDAILLTHNHKDHTGGLDDVRALEYFNHGKPLSIYCEAYVLESLKKEYAYAFEEHPYPGAPQFDVHIIDERPFTISKACPASNSLADAGAQNNQLVNQKEHTPQQSITVTPIRAIHYKLPILAFRFGGLCYLTDANHIPEDQFEKLKDLEIFTINSVRRIPHISHFSLPEALEVIKKVGARQSFITHLSHQMAEDSKNIQGTHSALSAEFPPGVAPAYDGLKVFFGSPQDAPVKL